MLHPNFFATSHCDCASRPQIGHFDCGFGDLPGQQETDRTVPNKGTSDTNTVRRFAPMPWLTWQLPGVTQVALWERLERRVLSLLAAGKPSESLSVESPTASILAAATARLGTDMEDTPMRNPSGTLCVFFIFLGGSYLGSGLWSLRKGGRRESGLGTWLHGNFARSVPVSTSVFSRVRTATLVLHFPTAISRGQCRDAGPVVRRASTTPRAGLSPRTGCSHVWPFNLDFLHHLTGTVQPNTPPFSSPNLRSDPRTSHYLFQTYAPVVPCPTHTPYMLTRDKPQIVNSLPHCTRLDSPPASPCCQATTHSGPPLQRPQPVRRGPRRLHLLGRSHFTRCLVVRAPLCHRRGARRGPRCRRCRIAVQLLSLLQNLVLPPHCIPLPVSVPGGRTRLGEPFLPCFGHGHGTASLNPCHTFGLADRIPECACKGRVELDVISLNLRWLVCIGIVVLLDLFLGIPLQIPDIVSIALPPSPPGLRTRNSAAEAVPAPSTRR